jgi:RNA polymerase sigma factor (sigma-70 family)
MTDASDDELEKLIDLVNQGDEKALECLLERSFDRLLKRTRKMLSQFPALRRWEETDDVHVAVMVRLHKALKAVKPQSARHFFNLATQHIKWELLSLQRSYYGPRGIGKNHHTDQQPPDESGGSLARLPDPVEDMSRWEDLHEAIEQLPEDLREVVKLIYYHDLQVKHVAKVLDTTPSWVKRRWQEARLQLNEKLGESL